MNQLIFAAPRKIALLAFVGLMMVPAANAGIIKIKGEQSCSVYGLDAADAVRGGVHCDTGDTPFSLTGVLDGSLSLYVGDSQTPSWNLINDTGSFLTELTLYYSGALADNAFIDMQVGDSIFDVCFATDGNGVTTGEAGKCDAKTVKPEDGLALPLAMTWSGGDGLGINDIFNLGTASFAHSGQDAGCFSGTPNCEPSTSVPEPGLIVLVGMVLAGLGFRRQSRRPA